MTDYIALLRGINVGGHMVKMQDLTAYFRELELENVRTYIQSGNVFFKSDETDREKLATRIERYLEETLGYEVVVFLRTVAELGKILSGRPFGKREVRPDSRFCVVFARKPIQNDLELPLMSPKKDIEIIKTTKTEAYVIWYLIKGRPPSSQSFMDNNIGKDTTTRFFHTLQKMLEAAIGK